MVNCNPETVSTDYDTSDRLYFEPLTLEDVLNIVGASGRRRIARPGGAVRRQTPLNLATSLQAAGGSWGRRPTPLTWLKIATALANCWRNWRFPPRRTVRRTTEEAVEAARRIGYPVVVRPSYVLGGRAMAVVDDEEALRRYMVEAVAVSSQKSILIDQFLEDAFEIDVDAV